LKLAPPKNRVQAGEKFSALFLNETSPPLVLFGFPNRQSQFQVRQAARKKPGVIRE
jgi:hypothetical protein